MLSKWKIDNFGWASIAVVLILLALSLWTIEAKDGLRDYQYREEAWITFVRFFGSGALVMALLALYLGRKYRELLIERNIVMPRLENALRDSEASYRLILDNSQEIIYRIQLTPEIRFEFINKAVYRLLGYEPAEFYADPLILLKIVHPSDDTPLSSFSEVTGQIQQIATQRWKKKDGSYIWFESRRVPIYDDKKRLVAMHGLCFDVTERHRMQLTLEEERGRLATTIQVLIEAVITTDHTGKITLVNPAGVALLGRRAESLIGQMAQEVVSLESVKVSQDIHPVDAIIKETGAVADDNDLLHRFDHTTRSVLWSASPVINSEGKLESVVLVILDCTERTRVIEQEQRSKNLDSLGILAGGIAHHFNNLHSVVLGNVALARAAVGESSPATPPLIDAEASILQARELTKKLLTFSKGGEPISKPLDLLPILQAVTRDEVTSAQIKVEWQLPSTLFHVLADPVQITEAVRQLVRNAVEAMPQGGTLRLQIYNPTDALPNSLALMESDLQCLVIEDTGVGIAKEHHGKVFDPYFTTKSPKSGLGLSIAHSIVEQHHGSLTVQSLIGVGTKVIVQLPTAKNVAPSENDQDFSSTPSSLFSGKRVLVVDDEASILRISASMLTHLGCQTSIACEGRAALDLYAQARQQGQPYDAVIMDLTMPGGMGGSETIEHLRKIDPEVCAIVSSGYSDDPIMANYQRYGFRAMVPKPYRLNELQAVLGQVWAEPKAS